MNHSYAKGGDEKHGFELKIDRLNHFVRLHMWGLWNLEIANLFRADFVRLAREFHGAHWAVLVDSREYPVQSPQVTEIRQQVMSTIRTLGCVKVAVIVQAALYTMQFKRIAATSHMESSVFSDESTALAWLGKPFNESR